MKTTQFQTELAILGACRDARTWAARQTREEAWQSCPRGDWLLWYLDSTGHDTRDALCWCLERTRQLLAQAVEPQHEVLKVLGPFYPEPANLEDALITAGDFTHWLARELREKHLAQIQINTNTCIDFLRLMIADSALRIFNRGTSSLSSVSWVAGHNTRIAENVAVVSGVANNEAHLTAAFVRTRYKLPNFSMQRRRK